MQDNTGKMYGELLGDGYGFIALEGTLPDPLRGQDMDDWIVQGARVSYRGHKRTKDEDRGLITRLITHQHWSPVEQPQVTFSLRAPMAVIVHLLRHRSLHINGESSRFKEPTDDYYIPKVWRKQNLVNKQGSSGQLDPVDARIMSETMETVINVARSAYREAINRGVSREVARLLLPTDANYRSYMFTVDLRNLLNLIYLRSASDAQWETQQYSCGMFWLIYPHCPIALSVWLEKIANEDVRKQLTDWKETHGTPTPAQQST